MINRDELYDIYSNYDRTKDDDTKYLMTVVMAMADACPRRGTTWGGCAGCEQQCGQGYITTPGIVDIIFNKIVNCYNPDNYSPEIMFI